MVRGSRNGAAQSLSNAEFNDRVKRLLDKPSDTRPATLRETPRTSAKRLLRGEPKPGS